MSNSAPTRQLSSTPPSAITTAPFSTTTMKTPPPESTSRGNRIFYSPIQSIMLLLYSYL
jgi:hypothetical protein